VATKTTLDTSITVIVVVVKPSLYLPVLSYPSLTFKRRGEMEGERVRRWEEGKRGRRGGVAVLQWCECEWCVFMYLS
jgi:hypothetical protein